jgi:hypothetical protein
MDELRPFSPFPVNLRVPCPVPVTDTNGQSSRRRLPEVVDLLTSPDEDNSDANKAENSSEVVEKVGDGDNIKNSGKLEVLTPQSLCADQIIHPECCVTQSNASASDQSVLYTSGNQHEICCDISQPVKPNSEPCESSEDTLMNNGISGPLLAPDVSTVTNSSMENATVVSNDALCALGVGSETVGNATEQYNNKSEISEKDDSSSASQTKESFERTASELPTSEISENKSGEDNVAM